METIAVYWESRIRTYGLNLLEELILSQVRLPSAELGSWGETLQSLDAPCASFRLVWAQSANTGQIAFSLVCDPAHWQKVEPLLEQSPHCPPVRSIVDILFLQGPHFGDRYGIMDFTYQALAKGQVPLISAVCSVATIYLVLPAGWGRKAQRLLSEAFEIPQATAAGKTADGVDGDSGTDL